jgi:hypothetical protein
MTRQEVVDLVKEGMVARSKKEKRRRDLGEMTVMIIGSVWAAWLLMLVVGIIHAEWIHQLPTVDYGTSFAVAALLRGAFYNPRSRS